MRVERLLAWSCAALFWAGSGLAQTDEQRKTARDLMDQGDERAEQQDYQAALTLYRAAHDIMHVPTTGIEVARTLANLGKLVEARDTALEILNLPEAPEEPRPFTIARVAAEQLVRKLTQDIPTLRILLGPAEAARGAALRIDGRLVPQALKAAQPLDPGAHRIQVSAPGFESVELSATLAVGNRESVRIELRRFPAPPLESSLASPRALLDRRPERALARPWYSTSWPTWLGVGAVGAGVVTGTVAGLIAIDHVKAAREYCDGNRCTRQAAADRDAAFDAALVSNIGWVVAGAGAVLTVTSFWLDRRESASASEVSVLAAKGGGIVQWSGAL